MRVTSMGWTELRRNSAAFAKQARDAMRPAMESALEPLLSVATALTPKVTGTLQRAMGKKVVYLAQSQRSVIVGMVGARYDMEGAPLRGMRKNVSNRAFRLLFKDMPHVRPTRYLHLVENGTQRAKAARQLARALAATSSQIASRFESVMMSILPP